MGNPRAKSQEPSVGIRESGIGKQMNLIVFQLPISKPSQAIQLSGWPATSANSIQLIRQVCPNVRQASGPRPPNSQLSRRSIYLSGPTRNPAFTFILALSPAPPPTSSHVNLLSLQREQIYVCPTGRPKERAQVNRRIVSSSCGANLVACAPTCI